jgi:hypothetical protein
MPSLDVELSVRLLVTAEVPVAASGMGKDLTVHCAEVGKRVVWKV